MIYLNSDDIKYMLTILDLSYDEKQVLNNQFLSSGINDDFADDLRDKCTEKLDEIGFDENYKATKDGEKLEYLIDKLYIG